MLLRHENRHTTKDNRKLYDPQRTYEHSAKMRTPQVERTFHVHTVLVQRNKTKMRTTCILRFTTHKNVCKFTYKELNASPHNINIQYIIIVPFFKRKKKDLDKKMPESKVVDVGVALHSPSAELMKLVNIHHQSDNEKWTDFTTIVQYMQEHLYDIIYEVHHVYDKLLIDDTNTQINCPPEEQSNIYDTDTNTNTTINHTTLILRALSEKELPNGNGIVAKRDIKVYDCGITSGTDINDLEYHTIQIREDIIKSSNDETNVQPILYENEIQIIVGKKPTK
jgi:hypothetical protein